MSTRNPAAKIRRRSDHPALEPATELTRPREVAPGVEIPGHILPSDLAMPEGLAPEWAPMLLTMREALAGGVARVVRDLLAESHPDPLQLFPEGIADAATNARADTLPVPVATEWEITHLYASHAEGGSINVGVFLDDPVAGAQFDTIVAPTVVGGSRQYDRLKLRAGQRLSFAATGLTAGSYLRVAVLGVITSLRRNAEV